MAESGCLRDVHAQNLEVSGRSEIAGGINSLLYFR